MNRQFGDNVGDQELPGKRNVLEYRPAPAAKRDVWITARPHEPVLAK
jgi:hypothetical protein